MMNALRMKYGGQDVQILNKSIGETAFFGCNTLADINTFRWFGLAVCIAYSRDCGGNNNKYSNKTIQKNENYYR